MFQQKLAKIFLFPFSLIYGFAVSIRNTFYDTGMLKPTKFNLPVISIGNISIGGTGKTPHIEYLIELLHEYLELATLSRGYKRKSKGFRVVQTENNVSLVGDEPLQFKRKFPTLIVAVAESRNIGIPQLVLHNNNIQTVLLDDAFQHRSVAPGLNILLSDYSNPFYNDYLLPMGRLREWRTAYKRADIVIVSKCPKELGTTQIENIKKKINLQKHQTIFFSAYKYFQPYFIYDKGLTIDFDSQCSIILLSAIASTEYLKEFVNSKYNHVIHMQYEDHHYYNLQDLEQLSLTYKQIENPNKIILTTEKDGIRLAENKQYIIENKLPIYILPIKVEFLNNDGSIFDDLIKTYLLNFKY